MVKRRTRVYTVENLLLLHKLAPSKRTRRKRVIILDQDSDTEDTDDDCPRVGIGPELVENERESNLAKGRRIVDSRNNKDTGNFGVYENPTNSTKDEVIDLCADSDASENTSDDNSSGKSTADSSDAERKSTDTSVDELNRASDDTSDVGSNNKDNGNEKRDVLSPQNDDDDEFKGSQINTRSKKASKLDAANYEKTGKDDVRVNAANNDAKGVETEASTSKFDLIDLCDDTDISESNSDDQSHNKADVSSDDSDDDSNYDPDDNSITVSNNNCHEFQDKSLQPDNLDATIGAAAAATTTTATTTTLTATTSTKSAITLSTSFTESFLCEEESNKAINEEIKGCGPHPLDVFLEKWKLMEGRTGASLEELESQLGGMITRANSKIAKDDSQKQKKAMYGRIFWRATDKLLRQIMRLTKDHVFIDLGHGAGNICLQAAYTIGCHAKGIELVADRNKCSLTFKDGLEEVDKMERCKEGNKYIHGKVEFKRGSLEDVNYRNWILNSNAVFVNNYNDNFGTKAMKANAKNTLDDAVAGLFAQMQIGTIMVTAHELLGLGPTQKEANEQRRINGLKESKNASFFDMKKIELGYSKDTVSWGTCANRMIYVYKYTKLEQSHNQRSGGAVFLCSNKECKYARECKPQFAAKLTRENRLIIDTSCRFCNSSHKAERERKKTNRYAPSDFRP